MDPPVNTYKRLKNVFKYMYYNPEKGTFFLNYTYNIVNLRTL